MRFSLRVSLIALLMLILASGVAFADISCSTRGPLPPDVVRVFASKSDAEAYYPGKLLIGDQYVIWESWGWESSRIPATKVGSKEWRIYERTGGSLNGWGIRFVLMPNSGQIHAFMRSADGYRESSIPVIYRNCEDTEVSVQSQSGGKGSSSPTAKEEAAVSSNRSNSSGSNACDISRDELRALQQHLRTLGLYTSLIDGLWGPGTARAVEEAKGRIQSPSDGACPSSSDVEKIAALTQTDLTPSQANSCANDPTKCGAVELCVRGSELQNGERVWRSDTNGKPYAEAARSIGLSCNVTSELNDEVFRVASGTGFFVSNEGHVVTNQHVIDGCNEIQVHSDGRMTPATVVSQDNVNDLALLRTSQAPNGVFLLAEKNPQLLDDIIAAGFPFGESVSSSIKVTKGIVSSLSGLGDNSGQIQIDAALQPGNSGGPIVNLQGHVVGVAVAKLDVEKSIENFGAIPENVNFGIKLSSLKTFLDDSNIHYEVGNDAGIPNSELGRQIYNATVLLSCWMNEARIQTMANQRALFSAQSN